MVPLVKDGFSIIYLFILIFDNKLAQIYIIYLINRIHNTTTANSTNKARLREKCHKV